MNKESADLRGGHETTEKAVSSHRRADPVGEMPGLDDPRRELLLVDYLIGSVCGSFAFWELYFVEYPGAV